MDTPSQMDPAREHATRTEHDVDATHVHTHRRLLPLIRGPVYEGWVLTLGGIILMGLIGGLGWAAYRLSTVQAEVRQLRVHVAQLTPQSAAGEVVPEETARRLHEIDQRLHAVERWTKDMAPRLTGLPRRPRERTDQPPQPSPPQALLPTLQVPHNAHQEPRTLRDVQAHRDMLQQAAISKHFGTPVPNSFGTSLTWYPEWELRWMSFQVRGQSPIYVYHITYKPDPRHRYTIAREPDSKTGPQRARWQRVS